MFLAFLFSIIIFNTTDLSLIFLQIPFLTFHYFFFGNVAFHFLTLFSFLIATSGIIKAAQFFFHVWLPDAMEAPTPASALIHSSTLVIAGIFLIIRFSILFEFTILTNYYLAVLGAITLLFGAITATFQHDIKKLVAYSTISQIGYLTCGCGFGCYEEVLIYLILHALNKAFLFILVGYIVHFFNNNTDMRQMGGIYLYSFDISILLCGVCLNLTGLPYSAGFIGKEFLIFQFFKNDFFSFLIKSCWILSFFFTPIYMFLLLFIVIFGPKKGTPQTYLTFWKLNFFQINTILVNFLNKKNHFTLINNKNLFQFQLTILTCRTTIYVLFFFWIFFFSCGEFLLLILFNFSTITDAIQSDFFFFFKSHYIFSLNKFSTKFLYIFNFFLYFFIICALAYLLNFFYTFNFFYFTLNFQIDLVIVFFLLFYFQFFYLLIFFLLSLIYKNYIV